MLSTSAKSRRRFQLVLIKPSHYDDDGYVVQWMRSAMPANSLACLYGLAADADRRQVLGLDTDIEISAIDEYNARVRIKDIIKQLQRNDGLGLVALVGVQSNQYPRALDIARPLRAAGIAVAIGGFHVSGVLAMLPGIQPSLQEALDMGCSLFAGEAEERRMDRVLLDAANGTLEPIYNYMDDLPALEDAVTPYLPPRLTARTLKQHSSFDAGRGCPFQCSFCTIINVQGRKSRRRTPDNIEALIRQYYRDGVGRFLITDDNFARNKDWEAILDRIIELRLRENMDLRITIQVDTLCHKIPNFVEKAARAGVRQIFIGLENINPRNLAAAKKKQNKITEYRDMLLAWKQVGVVTYAGYILGFPADTPESIRQDIEIIKRELPVDVIGFFYLTPLPGSEDHKVLWQKGVWMDPDLNKYDLEHLVTDHPTMSREQYEGIYREVWKAFYTPEHLETIMRRGAATRTVLARLTSMLFYYSTTRAYEGVHPQQAGVIRMKYRLDRRPGLPIEPAWSFYPKVVSEFIWKQSVMGKNLVKLLLLMWRIRSDPKRFDYMDQALRPVTADDTASLEIFTHSEDARAAVEHTRKIEGLTGGGRTPAPANA
jgi:hypothetical protein